ncbi:MAG: DUF433 domain-containing protein [Symploca sp. SIO3E6]|nr:DUF433 domain-containing protein [Caldora sp. SIO3E6]
MNTKLVKSLAEAVNALEPEHYALFQSTLITKTIQKTPGVCGGNARIRNTRIAVWTLISLMVVLSFVHGGTKPNPTNTALCAVMKYSRQKSPLGRGMRGGSTVYLIAEQTAVSPWHTYI